MKSVDMLSLESTFEYIGFGRFQCILVMTCGILQSFDAIEMLILAFIQPIMKCVWQSTIWEETFLIIGVFVGMIFGGLILGRLCDIYGRKSILVISSVALVYFGFICAASPNLLWITIIRTFIGVFLGGIMSSLSTLASELMPIINRGSALITVLAFWPLGSYMITILCVTIVPTLGWRAFLAISTCPILLSLPFLIWLPESPRFLLLKLRKKEAIEVINRVADINGKVRITDISNLSQDSHSYWDLVHPNYLSTTLFTFLLWFISGLTYYGIILIISSINRIPRQCLQNKEMYVFTGTNSNSTFDDSCCYRLTWSSTKDVFFSTTGELIFIPITIYMINTIGRKHSLVFLNLLTAIMFVIMNFCMHPLAQSALLFVARGCINSSFNINYIYTSEVFPTSVRSVSIGLCSTGARLGAILSPFVVNVIIMKSSFLSGTMVFTFVNSAAFVLALMLPYETKGRPLFQTAEEYTVSK